MIEKGVKSIGDWIFQNCGTYQIYQFLVQLNQIRFLDASVFNLSKFQMKIIISQILKMMELYMIQAWRKPNKKSKEVLY